MAPTGQLSPHRTPIAVAMPLPPLKRSHTGKLCPSTAPSPAATPMIGPNIAQAITATKPFSASRIKVAAARPLLPVRSTLVAPMLPDPMVRMSPRPAARVRTSPNGIEPSRYPKTKGARRWAAYHIIDRPFLWVHHPAARAVDEGGGRRTDQLGRDLFPGSQQDRAEIGFADRAAAVEEAALDL